MASDSDRERGAAAFFSHLFRATISSDISEETQIFHPIIVGLLSGPFSPEDGSASDRILLVHPISRRVAVLRGDPNLLTELLSASAGRKGPPPATKASIEAMLTVEIADSGEECSVCLDEFGQAVVKEMPCKHRFHGDCIDKWLGLHGTCPVCRYCMPAEESGAKKVDGDGDGDGQEGERAVWFEITFGRGRSGDRDQEHEQQGGEQSVDSNSV
ncbi:hypothetical protein M5K25_022974 [Dendrobium thyrsiflorum]|uniref:RING-type E3 ubiquitin transferase n=1 Tax=Dendrobium thyrsiflorum TaxID=117978 RepID=A0ABD0U744_DENTH